MDFDGAIQVHTNWKLRFLNYVRGWANEKIDCALCPWLYGEGQKYANDPRFAKLRETDTAFHSAAASVGLLVDQGNKASAEAVLNSPDTEFNRLSFRIVAMLMDLSAVSPPAVPQAISRTAQTDPQATRLPIAAPASTSLRKCIPSRMREAAMLRAQNSRPVARSG